MIERKDLKEMVHEGRDLKSFVIRLSDEDLQCGLSAIFRRKKGNYTAWHVHVILDDGNGDKDTLLEFTFMQPSRSMKIETVAAQGLMVLEQVLESQVQSRQVLLSKLYEMTRGM